jgi:putative metallohydrolase (TIGR04338 family)
MKQPRDSQRSKLYKAERIAEVDSKSYPDLSDCQNYILKCLKSKRLLKLYPFMNGVFVEVKDGRGCRNASGGRYSITLPRWARTEWVMLHELAHTITMRKYVKRVAPHGREYAVVYLNLVRIFLGRESEKQLKLAFKTHRVKYRKPRKPIVGRPKGVIPEGLRKYLESKRTAKPIEDLQHGS